MIDIQKIVPPHGARDTEKLTELIRSMCVDGWVGAPIVAIEVGGTFFALTGSHRIAAARATELWEIPVEVIEGSILSPEQWEELNMARNTEEFTTTFDQIVMDGTRGLDAALNLLHAEVEKERA